MSLTEHLEYAKKKAMEAEQQRIKAEKEAKAKKLKEEKDKKDKEKKMAAEKAKMDKKKKEQAMKDAAEIGFDPQDFADGDLDLGLGDKEALNATQIENLQVDIDGGVPKETYKEYLMKKAIEADPKLAQVVEGAEGNSSQSLGEQKDET